MVGQCSRDEWGKDRFHRNPGYRDWGEGVKLRLRFCFNSATAGGRTGGRWNPRWFVQRFEECLEVGEVAIVQAQGAEPGRFGGGRGGVRLGLAGGAFQGCHPGVVHSQHPFELEDSIVHIGLGVAHVAEAGRAEPADVGGVAGDPVAAQVFESPAVVAQAEVMELAVAEVWPIVAVRATRGPSEQVEPGDRLVRERPWSSP